jgi:hypothetical protein
MFRQLSISLFCKSDFHCSYEQDNDAENTISHPNYCWQPDEYPAPVNDVGYLQDKEDYRVKYDPTESVNFDGEIKI